MNNMSKKAQTQTNSSQVPENGGKRENLTKKLSGYRETVALPKIGNVSIKIDDIEDIQMVTVNGKLKLKIIFKDTEGMRYALVGTTFIDQVNECIKNGNELNIIREPETLRTYIECQ